MTYHTFNGHGSFETWFVGHDDPRTKPVTLDSQAMRESFGDTLPAIEPGWYWWACFPGCLPDGEASGPFETEQDAINDAQDF